MGRTITFFFLFFSFCSTGQVFNGTGGSLLNDGQNTYFTLSVSGLPASLGSTFGIEEVCLQINHSAVEELYIYLESPGGRIVELTQGGSCKGANYTNTCFDSKAGTSVTLATAPYSGLYKPIGFLGRFNDQPGNGNWKLIVKDYLAFVNPGTLLSWSIRFGNSPVPALIFTSSNLPLVVINTNNQALSDSEIMVDMGIIYNGPGQRNNTSDPHNNYTGKALVNFRGNSSKNYEKKPYSVETTDGAGNERIASLLEMPPESDWNLISMYQDKSLIRIPFTYDLSRKMGHYAARCKATEVVINNEYQGVYYLMEKPKRDINRIDVAKLTPADNVYPAISGGYVVKIDRTDEAGWYSLYPGDSQSNSHFYYQYVYPNDLSITPQQKVYIKNVMDNFETVMNSPSFSSPTSGYAKFIDVGSFIDLFIINELSKNVDGYRLSTYLYKDNDNKGGKIHIGPVWDYDIAWHNCNYGNSFDPSGWEYQLTDTLHPTPTWWSRFMQDTNFINALYCRWNELRKDVLKTDYLYASIDSAAVALNESQQRNFTQWPILGAYIFPNPQNQINTSYQNEVNDLKNWIAGRIAWMDGAISGQCSLGRIPENNFDNSISVYPNPFTTTTTFALRLSEEADVTLKIVDVMGKEVFVLLNEHKVAGESSILFDREQLAAGIYFYQLTMNDSMKTGKIIIQ